MSGLAIERTVTARVGEFWPLNLGDGFSLPEWRSNDYPNNESSSFRCEKRIPKSWKKIPWSRGTFLVSFLKIQIMTVTVLITSSLSNFALDNIGQLSTIPPNFVKIE